MLAFGCMEKSAGQTSTDFLQVVSFLFVAWIRSAGWNDMNFYLEKK